MIQIDGEFCYCNSNDCNVEHCDHDHCDCAFADPEDCHNHEETTTKKNDDGMTTTSGSTFPKLSMLSFFSLIFSIGLRMLH